MRIDAHQHFWMYQAAEYPWISDDMSTLKLDWLPADLRGSLRQAGYEACIAVQARQSSAENSFLLSLAHAHEWIVGVVGWIDLTSSSLPEELAQWRGYPKLKGFRHILQDEPAPDFMLRAAFVEGLRYLGQQGYAYDILVYERQLPQVLQLVAQCPEQPLILDHLGKPEIGERPSQRWQEAIRQLAQYPQVYCKLSGLVTEVVGGQWRTVDFRPYLETVYEAFGPKRLLIGSDWPVCLLAAAGYSDALSVVDQFLNQLSSSEQAWIRGGNAAAVYGISVDASDG
ncbi:MAG: amidohydrolase family protein [Bacteroidota bacterium]